MDRRLEADEYGCEQDFHVFVQPGDFSRYRKVETAEARDNIGTYLER
jgi:hypothetical protein